MSADKKLDYSTASILYTEQEDVVEEVEVNLDEVPEQDPAPSQKKYRDIWFILKHKLNEMFLAREHPQIEKVLKAMNKLENRLHKS